MSSNKNAKNKLIQLYGEECFIEKLHLRIDTKPRRYTSKGQKERMKQITYHHMLEKSKGGKATVENGALLSRENHTWFHQQSPQKQAYMNDLFRQYKKCSVVFVDDLECPFQVKATTFSIPLEKDLDNPKDKRMVAHNRAKVKQKTKELIQEYYDDEEER